MSSASRIASLDSIPENSTLVFRVTPVDDADSSSGRTETPAGSDDTVTEAILVRTDDGIACWHNTCQHLTHIPLDKGSGAAMRNGEIICENHGAYFEADTGRCTYGPCEGAYLTELAVAIRENAVYLVDDDYVFSELGPIPTDDTARGSTSNVEL
ncbi:Rieske (2Fe-2S) protein [Halobacteria archaeon AArc-dxtr1]|nr:Rieske (2Fe-2S) protein [Halobacteria archaeon AArc-dxtr1]